MPDVIATCRQVFADKGGRLGDDSSTPAADSHLGGRRMKGDYLRNLLSNDDLRHYPRLVDFALSDAAMGMAASYLGTIPYLNRVDLLYSIARASEDKVSSQLFHVDPEGLTQVKFFINVFDVGEGEGPFTFIPADDTARILDVTVHQLLEDSSVDPDQASRTLLRVLGIEAPKQQQLDV